MNNIFFNNEIKNKFEIKRSQTLFFIYTDKSFEQKILIDIKAENVKLKVRCIVLSTSKMIGKLNLNTKHTFASSSSDISFFSFSTDSSSVSSTLETHIPFGSSNSKVNQNIEMIVDKEAHASGEPVLIIDEYDVDAHHGNSIGNFSEEELYYLQTKGLTKEESKDILIKGKLLKLLDGLDESDKNKVLDSFERITHHVE